MTKDKTEQHKKHAVSSYYARNITSDDVIKAQEVIDSDVAQIEDAFEGTPNRELSFVTKERMKKGKNRKFYAKRGYSQGIDSLKQANTAYSQRLNLLQPTGSEVKIPPTVDVTGQPVPQVRERIQQFIVERNANRDQGPQIRDQIQNYISRLASEQFWKLLRSQVLPRDR